MSICTDALNRRVAAVEDGDADAYAALFSEDAVALHPLPEPVTGRSAIRAAEQQLFDSSQVKVEVRDVAGDQNRCAAEVVLQAVSSGPLAP